MRISVIMPCHNASRWIAAALRSISKQAHSAHEIVVIDDGSTDNSVLEIERTSVPVKLLRTEFRNAAAARNAGIEAATGDWIALLDADDVWYPNHLERAAEVLAGTSDVAYRAICDDITHDGIRVPVPPQPITTTRTGITHREYIGYENRDLYFGHSSCVVGRDRLREIGGYAPE